MELEQKKIKLASKTGMESIYYQGGLKEELEKLTKDALNP